MLAQLKEPIKMHKTPLETLSIYSQQLDFLARWFKNAQQVSREMKKLSCAIIDDLLQVIYFGVDLNGNCQ